MLRLSLWVFFITFWHSLILIEAYCHVSFSQTLSSLCNKGSSITYARSLRHYLQCFHKISCFESTDPTWYPIASYPVASSLRQPQVWGNEILGGPWFCFFSKCFVSFGNPSRRKGLIFDECFEKGENCPCSKGFPFMSKTLAIKLLTSVIYHMCNQRIFYSHPFLQLLLSACLHFCFKP